MLGEGKGEQWKPEASWAQIKLPPVNRETTMTHKRICHYIYVYFLLWPIYKPLFQHTFQKHRFVSCYPFLKSELLKVFFIQKCTFNKDKEGTRCLGGAGSLLLCPFMGQAIQGTWILVCFLSWFPLSGPSTTPEDLHVCVVLPSFICLGCLLKNSLAWWLVAIHLSTFSCADDC